MLRSVKLWLVHKVCDWFHKENHLYIPMYKTGTYEKIGTMLVCTRCLKEEGR